MSFNFALKDNTPQSKAEHSMFKLISSPFDLFPIHLTPFHCIGLEDMFLQTLEKRYVKKQALLEFLDNNFGSTGYEVEVSNFNPQ